MHASLRLFTASTLIMGLLVSAGCGGGGGANQASLKANEVVGKWTERPATLAPSAKDQNVRRELEINDGGKFKVTVTDLQGKAVAPPRTSEGTWEVKGRSIFFKVTTDQLGTGEMDSPMQSLIIQLKSRGHEKNQIEVRDVKGGRTVYFRD